jgi:hypothetical protein
LNYEIKNKLNFYKKGQEQKLKKIKKNKNWSYNINNKDDQVVIF